MESVERQTGQRPAALNGPAIPEAGAYLWVWFLELHCSRGGGFGPSALTYSEILAWAALTGSDPVPWEIQIIKALDGAWLTSREKDK